MSSLIPMAGAQALQGAQTRNNGGQAGFLGGSGAIDGSGQSFWNLADPFNTTGHASSGHALSNIFDPGNVLGMNQAANPNSGQSNGSAVPSVLPNMGINPTYYNPNSFVNRGNPGGGQFNAMANHAAGQMYSPQAIGGKGAGTPGGKGGMPAGNTMPTNPVGGHMLRNKP